MQVPQKDPVFYQSKASDGGGDKVIAAAVIKSRAEPCYIPLSKAQKLVGKLRSHSHRQNSKVNGQGEGKCTVVSDYCSDGFSR
jgi:hypothetical protein